ncbi:hypothetical protein GCM10027053_22050 [Intrasporangium mesophilum]
MTQGRRSGSVDRLLRARIAGQSGLVTRRQALSGGFTDEQIRWKVASSRWVTLHPGVYLTTPGRDDWEMHAVAALLAVGTPAALCGRSAAFAWGLLPDPGSLIELVVPAGRRRSALPGVRTTRSRAMVQRTDPHVWPHRTTVEHTILDLSVGKGLDGVVALIAKASQLGLTDERRMATALRARPNQTHHALLAECLADIGEGVESVAELRYVRDVERAHGLPVGLRQGPGRSSTVRDSVYEEPMVVVEVDGRRGHDGWRGRQRDGRRDRGAAADGWLTVRVFWIDVAGTPCRLAVEMGQVLRARGWQGAVRPCRRAGCEARPAV